MKPRHPASVAVALCCILAVSQAAVRQIDFESGADSGDCSVSPCATIAFTFTQTSISGDVIEFLNSPPTGVSITVEAAAFTDLTLRSAAENGNFECSSLTLSFTGGSYTVQDMWINTTNQNSHVFEFHDCDTVAFENINFKAAGGVALFDGTAQSKVTNVTLIDYDVVLEPLEFMNVPLFKYVYGEHVVHNFTGVATVLPVAVEGANHASFFSLEPHPHRVDLPVQSLTFKDSKLYGGAFDDFSACVHLSGNYSLPAVGADVRVSLINSMFIDVTTSNRGTGFGALLYASLGINSVTIEVTGCSFTRNIVNYGEGAVAYEMVADTYEYNTPTTAITLTSCNFIDGVNNNAGLSVNEMEGQVMGKFNSSLLFGSRLAVTIDNCLFEGFLDLFDGSLVLFHAPGNLTLTNSILRNGDGSTRGSQGYVAVTADAYAHLRVVNCEISNLGRHVFTFNDQVDSTEGSPASGPAASETFTDYVYYQTASEDTRLKLTITNSTFDLSNTLTMLRNDIYVQIDVSNSEFFNGGAGGAPAFNVHWNILPVRFVNCSFHDNANYLMFSIDSSSIVTLGPGALGLTFVHNATIEDCVFENNIGNGGGGLAVFSNWGYWGSPAVYVPRTFGPQSTLTIRRNVFTANTATNIGGGGLNVDVADRGLASDAYQPATDSDVSIEDNEFYNNEATGGGGGAVIGISAYSTDYGVPLAVITGNTFDSNTADKCGGLVLTNDGLDDDEVGNVFLTDSTFTRNSATSSSAGGLCVEPIGGLTVLEDLHVANNTGASVGGIHMHVDMFYFAVISGRNLTVTGNTGSSGGIRADRLVELYECTITANEATSKGGGVYTSHTGFGVEDAGVKMAGCLVAGNTAAVDGGGFAADGVLDAARYTIVDSCNFTGNSAGAQGGAVYLDTTLVYVRNTVFEHNSAVFGAGLAVISTQNSFNLPRYVTVASSTFSNNVAFNVGGAIGASIGQDYNNPGTMNITVTDTDMNYNEANVDGPAIYADYSVVTSGANNCSTCDSFFSMSGGVSFGNVVAANGSVQTFTGRRWNLDLGNHVLSNHTVGGSGTHLSVPAGVTNASYDGLSFICGVSDYIVDCTGSKAGGEISPSVITVCQTEYIDTTPAGACLVALDDSFVVCENSTTPTIISATVEAVVDRGTPFDITFTAVRGATIVFEVLPTSDFLDADSYPAVVTAVATGSEQTVQATALVEGQYYVSLYIDGAESCGAAMSNKFLAYQVDVFYYGLGDYVFYLGETFNFSSNLDFTGNPLSGRSEVGAVTTADESTFLTGGDAGYPFDTDCGEVNITNGFIYSCRVAFRYEGSYKFAVKPTSVDQGPLAEQLFVGIPRLSDAVTSVAPTLRFDSTVNSALVKGVAYGGNLRFHIEDGSGAALRYASDDLSIVITIADDLPISYTATTANSNGELSVTGFTVSGVKESSSILAVSFYLSYNDTAVGTPVLTNFNLFCPDGTYNNGGNCTECPIGYYGGYSSSGQPECVVCDDGYYAPSAGLEDCLECPTGTVPDAGRTGCVPCAPGKTAEGGDSECSNCPVGTFSPSYNVSCTACPAGMYQDSTGQTSCKVCPDGRVTTAASSKVTCSACGVGATSNADHTSCVDCPKGYFGDEEVNAACSPCLDGFVQPTPGQGDCIDCEAGTFAENATKCTDCQPGTAAEQHSTNCTICPPGYYTSTIKASACLACPLNTFSRNAGSDECTACGKNEVTLSEGTSRGWDCVCAKNYYRPAKFEDNRKQCTSCPEGGVCDGGEGDPYPAPGYFLSDGASDVFVACDPVSACNGSNVCNKGYTGFACGSCDEGYYRVTGAGCKQCPEEQSGWKLVVGGIAAFVVCLAVTLCIAPNVDSHVVTPAGVKVLPPIASPQLAIAFFQVLAIFPQFDMDWPESLQVWFSAFSITNFNIELVSPECAIQFDFWSKWRLQMAMPFIVIGFFIVIFVMLVAFRLCKAKFDGVWDDLDLWDEIRRRALIAGAGLLFVILLLQLALTQVVLTYFDCTKLPGSDRSTLDAEPSIFCDEPEFAEHRWMAVGGLIVYVFGIPLILVGTLLYVYFNRGYTFLSHYPLTSNFVKKYAKKYFFFEIVVLARKNGVLVVAIMLTTRVAEQAVLAFLVLLTALLLTALTQPFRFVYHDTLEFVLTLTSLMALFAGLVLSISDLSDSSRTGLTVVIHILIVISLITIAVCFVFEVRLRWHLVESAFGRFGKKEENPECAECKNNGRFNVDAVVMCKLCKSALCGECRLSHGIGERTIHPIVLLDAHDKSKVIDIPCDVCIDMSDEFFEDPYGGVNLKLLASPLAKPGTPRDFEDVESAASEETGSSASGIKGRRHVTATVKCIQCHQHLCDRCQRMHIMFAGNAKHDLIPIDDFALPSDVNMSRSRSRSLESVGGGFVADKSFSDSDFYDSDSYYGTEEGSTGGAKGESVSVSARVGEGSGSVSGSESGGETASSGSTESGGGEGANLVGGSGSEEYTYSES